MDCHVPPDQNGDGRPDEDLEVHEERAALHIQPVEGCLLREQLRHVLSDSVARVKDLALLGEGKLAEASDARLHREDDLVVLAPQLHELRVFRPRAHERHLALEHVPELRQLVELRLRERPADPGEPGVVGKRESHARRGVVHLAELEHRELAAAKADTPAPEEHGAAAVELDCCSDNRQHWREKHEHERRDGDVEQSFEGVAETPTRDRGRNPQQTNHPLPSSGDRTGVPACTHVIRAEQRLHVFLKFVPNLSPTRRKVSIGRMDYVSTAHVPAHWSRYLSETCADG
jgi:hypothetical protein